MGLDTHAHQESRDSKHIVGRDPARPCPCRQWPSPPRLFPQSTSVNVAVRHANSALHVRLHVTLGDRPGDIDATTARRHLRAICARSRAPIQATTLTVTALPIIRY